jgi:hypothetical protein
MTLANGQVTVPTHTWKVALVIPKDGGDDTSRVSCSSRTIAVIMPNAQGIRNEPWENFLTTVDAVETLTGYNLFSRLPEPIQGCVEAGLNGNNPPLVKGQQTITFGAPVPSPRYGDQPFEITATGGASGNPVTFSGSGACTVQGTNGSALVTIVSAGACDVTASQAGSAIYEPAPNATLAIPVVKATPAFSALDAPTIEAGTATVSIAGTLTAGPLVPAGVVSVSVGGLSVNAAIGGDGRFTATVPAGSLSVANSPYALGFSYGGDTNFHGAIGSSALRVIDTTAPAITGVTTSPDTLGAPNHKMIDVRVGYTVADFSGAPVCSLSVSSSEPVDGAADGHTSIDWMVIDARRVQLRAERAGGGPGRVYTIAITCTDAAGNASTGTGVVRVPR